MTGLLFAGFGHWHPKLCLAAACGLHTLLLAYVVYNNPFLHNFLNRWTAYGTMRLLPLLLVYGFHCFGFTEPAAERNHHRCSGHIYCIGACGLALQAVVIDDVANQQSLKHLVSLISVANSVLALPRVAPAASPAATARG